VLFVASEPVDGEPLEQHCAVRNLEVEEILKLFLELCEVVRFCHLHDVVHGGIRPRSVLVDTCGHVKLLDLGLAEIMPTGAGPAADAAVSEFASPEQAHGERLDSRSDVYSLGVVLYRLLTRLPLRPSGRSPSARGGRVLERRSPRACACAG